MGLYRNVRVFGSARSSCVFTIVRIIIPFLFQYDFHVNGLFIHQDTIQICTTNRSLAYYNANSSTSESKMVRKWMEAHSVRKQTNISCRQRSLRSRDMTVACWSRRLCCEVKDLKGHVSFISCVYITYSACEKQEYATLSVILYRWRMYVLDNIHYPLYFS